MAKIDKDLAMPEKNIFFQKYEKVVDFDKRNVYIVFVVREMVINYKNGDKKMGMIIDFREREIVVENEYILVKFVEKDSKWVFIESCFVDNEIEYRVVNDLLEINKIKDEREKIKKGMDFMDELEKNIKKYL